MYNRQLVVVDWHGNDTGRNLAIHKHHHPIIMLKEDREGLVTQTVLCKNGKAIVINIYNETWKFKRNITPFDIER